KKSDAMGWFKNVFTAPKPSAAPDNQYQKIGLNPKYSFDNFVVGQSNRFAHAAALAISENPAKTYNPLFIHGGVGLGKTHLLHAIGNRILELFPKSRILFISSEEFTNQLITAIRTRSQSNFRNMYRNVDVLLIDDIQFIAGKESTQEEFFHTFNRLYDSHNQIVLSSDRSPKEIPKLEERLVSRFDWGLRADIQSPDFETRTAIFEKKCELESIEMPHDVIFFLAEKVRTNIREMEGALIRVVAYANLTGNKLTVDLAKEILKDMILEEEKKISLDSIQEAIADHFNISVKELKSRKRTQAIAYPRQIAMYLARELTGHSLPEIGSSMGDRDHTTVLHAVDKIKRDLSTNSNLKGLLDKLTARIKNRN
ncbi:MAG: chromosomal replication initiator protein DnaA, partial [Candidatus Omnitrophica bacterium]|nr:chromosomal replication initiator protein DnaA [Candidatus Omnitrophota bacterium]